MNNKYSNAFTHLSHTLQHWSIDKYNLTTALLNILKSNNGSLNIQNNNNNNNNNNPICKAPECQKTSVALEQEISVS